MQRRSEHRYEVWESVVLTAQDSAGKRHFAATIIDISKSGYRVLLGAQLRVGTQVSITLHSVAIVGSVRHCERAKPDSFTVGVQITGVTGGVAEARTQLAIEPRSSDASVLTSAQPTLGNAGRMRCGSPD